MHNAFICVLFEEEYFKTLNVVNKFIPISIIQIHVENIHID